MHQDGLAVMLQTQCANIRLPLNLVELQLRNVFASHWACGSKEDEKEQCTKMPLKSGIP